MCCTWFAQDCVLGSVSWRSTTVKWWQSSRHSTIGARQTEYHEALPSSANHEVRCDSTFTDDGNASWYSVCSVPMVEWRLNCPHLTVVGLHDTGPWTLKPTCLRGPMRLLKKKKNISKCAFQCDHHRRGWWCAWVVVQRRTANAAATEAAITCAQLKLPFTLILQS